MKEEIFGPLLPVVAVKNIDEAIKLINNMDKPLGMYIFTSDQKVVDKILANTSSGGVTVNDCMLHVLVDELPFGGVGPSGMGAVHGVRGFDEFSHIRSVLHRGNTSIDLIGKSRYPPHNQAKYDELVMFGLNVSFIKKTFKTAARVAVPVAVSAAVVLYSNL